MWLYMQEYDVCPISRCKDKNLESVIFDEHIKLGPLGNRLA